MTAEAARDKAFQRLLVRPDNAWPTIALFVTYITVFTVATVLALQGEISLYLALGINASCCYVSYTVLHEASHGLVSKHAVCNDWFGRISLLFVSLTPFFKTYRFLHMMHHHYTNDPAKDPDYSCGKGPVWLLPWRWMVMDMAYVTTYFHPDYYPKRPADERRGFWLSWLFAGAVIATVVVGGWVEQFVVLYFIPTRIALFLLAITFDYLPHYPHQTRAADNKYRATNNRLGMEWLFGPLFIGHNYHLSHHLYPGAPFYRYRKIWEASKHRLLPRDPALVAGVKLAPKPAILCDIKQEHHYERR